MLMTSCLQSAAADTSIPGDLFFFPNIQATNTSGSGAPIDTEENKIEAGIDFFYSYSDERFLALIEYFISRDENEFERFQLGWKADKNTNIWLGRYHNVLGYWNSAYHHGTYLQTSISRPSIAEFEDDGGVLPMHISGFLLNHENLSSDSKLNFDLSLGYGPTMETGNLEPVEIFSPGGETFHENISLRLTYFPGLFSNTQIGLFAGHSRIEGDNITFSEIEQDQIGIFGLLEGDSLTFLSSVYFIDTTLKSATGGADSNGDFINGYLQIDYLFIDKWTAFTRLENTFDEKDDPYLALIPGFINEREVAGIRYDIVAKNALTLEIRKDHSLAGSINYIVLQWSALLP